MSRLDQLAQQARTPPTSAPAPPSPALLTMPLLQHPSPYWVDPAAVVAAAAASQQPATQHIHYISVAPPASAATPAPSTVPSPATATASDSLAPRPRKPYTTTKVREMWSPTEHDRMLEGLRLFKRDWAKVTRFVGTRSPAQVRSHAQKYFDRVARDNTNDYVPRARPKRKSATPYPRKPRDDLSQQPHGPVQHALSQHAVQIPHSGNSIPAPVPITIPVQSMHHQALTVQQQAVIAHAHQVHHPSVPVQLSAQSPLVSQMPANSPCLTQQPQHTIPMQQAVPQHVYSPFLAMYPPPPTGQDAQGIQTSPAPHPSPMSFVSSPYLGQSPATHQQVSAPQSHQPMYSVFSPMTPGGYPAGMARSPTMNHAQVSMVAAPQVQTHPVQPQHFPTHSHPGGPMENCAKCAALQRYGNVLQEIGEFRYPLMPQPAQNIVQGTVQPVPGQTATSVPRDCMQAPEPVENPPRTNATQNASSASSPSREGLGGSSGKRASDGSSCPSAEDLKPNGSTRGAAGHRAHRAKVMKARKAKNRISNANSTSKSASAGESEESNESFNSSRIKHTEESLARGKEKKSEPAKSTKTKDLQKRDTGSRSANLTIKKKTRTSGSAGERPAKRSRRPNQGDVSGKKVSTVDMSSKLADVRNAGSHTSGSSSPATRLACEGSEESGGKRMNSPAVDTYTPNEQKEIFDAVKSLQILAKTSSSSSPESKRGGAESISQA